MKKTLLIGATAILLATTGAFAQQGTTLAGPTQGGTDNGATPVVPSGAYVGSQRRGVNQDTGIPNDVATGTMSGKTTATGGNPGGAAGRN